MYDTENRPFNSHDDGSRQKNKCQVDKAYIFHFSLEDLVSLENLSLLRDFNLSNNQVSGKKILFSFLEFTLRAKNLFKC